jgi:hypothetical protein
MSENEPQPVEGEPAPQPPDPDEVEVGEAPEDEVDTGDEGVEAPVERPVDLGDQESAGEPVPEEGA